MRWTFPAALGSAEVERRGETRDSTPEPHSSPGQEPTTRFRLFAGLYGAWVVLSVAASIAIGGLTPENRTRLLVLAFLLGQYLVRRRLVFAFPSIPSSARFVLLGCILAAVVEGFHMISTPVFLSLRIGPGTPFIEGARRLAIDLGFTLPAYVVVLSVIRWFAVRYDFGLAAYVGVMGLGQTLGDGGLVYFLGSPVMLAFLPFPMTNYHAMNVVPYLATREDRERRPLSQSRARFLAVPVLVAVYFVCGSAIRIAGKRLGFDG